jgi:hypothetical protein
MSAWFDSAFEDFLGDLIEGHFDEGEVPEEIKKLLKLAYIAGAREGLSFSQQVLADELA